MVGFDPSLFGDIACESGDNLVVLFKQCGRWKWGFPTDDGLDASTQDGRFLGCIR